MSAASNEPTQPSGEIKQIGEALYSQLHPPHLSWEETNKDQLAKAAKARKAAQEAEKAKQQAQPVQAASVVSRPLSAAPTGSCEDWMKAAGVTDMANAYTLIMKESGCNPNAVNSSTGACGIGQQLPCGKWPHRWNDPVGGIIDMQNYVLTRYGSWANALAFHYGHNWY